ncbi:hypothetical protein [Bacillus thuringiensis]|uniref:hypothetical protein n=1 Tax=Bacillus thuringiensis TaxID=1428 RepID=UPI000BF45418|nr:hypothetical protein [Bacillus thuringiensis]PEV93986.1 hypothetical protein CN442_00830 [Bacillus thuringiensis]PGS85291.1 hypothetical protein COD02_10235 [Bacillus thuringiensis]PGT87500.1 hypothetical protein COD17_15590 [Bacillus thuringiensis]
MSEKLNDIIKQLQDQGNQTASPSNAQKDTPVFKSKMLLEKSLPKFGVKAEYFSEKENNNKKTN